MARAKKPTNVDPEIQADVDGGNIVSLVRDEFEKHRSISRKDFLRIEFLLRRGRRQLELLKGSNVTGVTFSHLMSSKRQE